MRKLVGAAVVAAALSFTGLVSVAPANAAPPVATVSPGYDAQLAQARSTDISARRYYRGYYRPYYRRYYRPYYGYRPHYYRPYPYYGYRPYYRPYGYGYPYGGYGYGPRFGFGFGF